MESILDKVLFLFNKSKEQDYTKEEYERILSYTNEHTDGLVVGRVFGYSISDYAIATLKWIGKPETISKYLDILRTLPENRKKEVTELVSKKLYEQI